MMDSEYNDEAIQIRIPYIPKNYPWPPLFADPEKGNGEGNSYLGASPPANYYSNIFLQSVVGKLDLQNWK